MKLYGYHDNYANCDVQQDDLSYLIYLTKDPDRKKELIGMTKK